jgi:hypothetical protein
MSMDKDLERVLRSASDAANYVGWNNWNQLIKEDLIKCCLSPDIVINEAGGTKFRVCKNCKHDHGDLIE